MPGKATTSASATNIARIIHTTQGMVLSIPTPAMRQDTIRFTAMGGVNCPIAIFMVRITPNQVRSQWKELAIGISTGSDLLNYIVVGFVWKTLVEAVVMPVTYVTIGFIKKREPSYWGEPV